MQKRFGQWSRFGQFWSKSFWLSNGTNICYFICRLVIFTYQPHHTSTILSGLNSNPHRHAAVAVVRPAAAAREAKEGLTPAAGEETEASGRPRRRRWRHGPVPRQGVRGREWHSPRRTGRASTCAGRRTAVSTPPATAAVPRLVAIGGWPPLAPTGSSCVGLTPPTWSQP